MGRDSVLNGVAHVRYGGQIFSAYTYIGSHRWYLMGSCVMHAFVPRQGECLPHTEMFRLTLTFVLVFTFGYLSDGLHLAL